MADDCKVVWVLGAGFSKSLGGPLLGDLLSPKSWPELKSRYERVLAVGGQLPADLTERQAQEHGRFLDSSEVRTIYEIFAYGTANFFEWRSTLNQDRGNDGGLRIWTDAEHFLEQLDSVAVSPSAKATILNIRARA